MAEGKKSTPLTSQNIQDSRFKRSIPVRRSYRRFRLFEEARRLNVRRLIVDAKIGIVGLSGSGRKTLGYRLINMNEGILEEVPANYFYSTSWNASCPEYPINVPFERVSIRFSAYIIEEPLELPSNNPPLYMEYWNEFCCLLFAFDVSNRDSFNAVHMKLTEYRRIGFRIPLYFIVANKSDLIYARPPRNSQSDERESGINEGTLNFEALNLEETSENSQNDERESAINERTFNLEALNIEAPSEYFQREREWMIDERTLALEAENLGTDYFICSAKNNSGVSELLTEVQIIALKHGRRLLSEMQ